MPRTIEMKKYYQSQSERTEILLKKEDSRGRTYHVRKGHGKVDEREWHLWEGRADAGAYDVENQFQTEDGDVIRFVDVEREDAEYQLAVKEGEGPISREEAEDLLDKRVQSNQAITPEGWTDVDRETMSDMGKMANDSTNAPDEVTINGTTYSKEEIQKVWSENPDVIRYL